MARLKLQMQVSADGFDAGGPDDDAAWREIEPYFRDLLDSTDTIVIGRKTAVEFIPCWDEKAANSDDPWHEIARRIAGAKKSRVFQDARQVLVEKHRCREGRSCRRD